MKRHAALCLMWVCSVQFAAACINDDGTDYDDWDSWGRGSRGSWGGGGCCGGGGIFDDDDDFFDDGFLGFDSLRVRTRDGDFEGRRFDRGRSFLGIPYAAPPVGDLRWRAPQPYSAPKSDEVRMAKEYGPRCAQRASQTYQSEASESEDCLYLNIWAPEEPSSKKLPVMVWIHGGDHANGSASERMPDGSSSVYYDGSKLASKDVIVASFNYRLGALGFLPHPDLKAEDGTYGNQGLLDQVAALKWIKQNIAAFGGDPNNITIFGQGSGAQDVCYHMVSPLSRGLFHQAISESGGCTDYQAEEGDFSEDMQRWLTKLGCTSSNALKCLRSKRVADVLSTTPVSNNPFRPFVDGKFLPDQPRSLFDSGDVNNAAYILGSNSDEGSLFKESYSNVDSEAAYLAVLQQYLPAAALAQVGQAYPKAQYADTAHPYQSALSHVLGDARVVCPTWDTARRASEAGLDVYMYNFDDATGVGGSGTAHGAELGYLFGTGKLSSDAQKNLSDLIQRYWTNFAAFGDPNASGAFSWPQYSNKNKSGVSLSPTVKVLTDLRERECNLWHSIYSTQFPASSTTLPGTSSTPASGTK